MNTIIETLRAIRGLFYEFSAYELWGMPIDMPLHFFVTFVLFFLFRHWLSNSLSIVIVVAAIFLKEVVDVFAKSRVEYIRPPALDASGDLLFGLLGLLLAYYVFNRRRENAEKGGRVAFAVMPMVVTAIAVFFLATGLRFTDQLGLLLVYAGFTVVALLLMPRYRHVLLFGILPFGALLNFAGPLGELYIYPMEIVIFIAAGLYPWLLSPADREQFRFDGVGRLLVALCGLVAFGAFVRWCGHGVFMDEVRLVRPYFLGFVMFYVLWLAHRQSHDYIRALQVGTLLTLLCVIGLALIESVYYLLSEGRWAYAPSALFRDSEPLAIYLCLVLPFVFACSREISSSTWRVFAYASVCLGFLVLASTRSRAGLLAIVAVALLYLLARARYRSAAHNVAWVVLGCVFCVVAGFVVFVKTASYVSVGDSFWGAALESRQANWAMGVEYIAGAPLFGNGSVENVYNLYLQVGAYFGIPALVVFLVLVGRVLYTAVLDSPSTLGLALGVIGVLAVGMAESPWGNQFAYLNWLFLFTLLWVSKSAAPAGVADERLAVYRSEVSRFSR